MTLVFSCSWFVGIFVHWVRHSPDSVIGPSQTVGRISASISHPTSPHFPASQPNPQGTSGRGLVGPNPGGAASANSHHRVAFAEDMCKHTVVRVVRNARRYVPPPSQAGRRAMPTSSPPSPTFSPPPSTMPLFSQTGLPLTPLPLHSRPSCSAGSFGPACIQCNPRRRSLPEALHSSQQRSHKTRSALFFMFHPYFEIAHPQ